MGSFFQERGDPQDRHKAKLEPRLLPGPPDLAPPDSILRTLKIIGGPGEQLELQIPWSFAALGSTLSDTHERARSPAFPGVA
jgi:hypothetical protein